MHYVSFCIFLSSIESVSWLRNPDNYLFIYRFSCTGRGEPSDVYLDGSHVRLFELKLSSSEDLVCIGERNFVYIYIWIKETDGFASPHVSEFVLLRVVSSLRLSALTMAGLRLPCVIGLLACPISLCALLSTGSPAGYDTSRLGPQNAPGYDLNITSIHLWIFHDGLGVGENS